MIELVQVPMELEDVHFVTEVLLGYAAHPVTGEMHTCLQITSGRKIQEEGAEEEAADEDDEDDEYEESVVIYVLSHELAEDVANRLAENIAMRRGGNLGGFGNA